MRLELLRHEAGEAGGKHIDKLRHEVTRLDEAVEALLRFMRPEQLKLSDFDVNELLKELGARVNCEKIKVEYQLDPALPSVQADRGLIYEALSNLITNAEQAMPDGGEIDAFQQVAGQRGRTDDRRPRSRNSQGATGSDFRLVLHHQSRRERPGSALRDAGDRTKRRKDSNRFRSWPRYHMQDNDSPCIQCACQTSGVQRGLSESIGDQSVRLPMSSHYH